VDNLSGMATGLAGRYATALFDLAREGKQIDSVSASLAKLRAALSESADFRSLVSSPLIGRDQASAAALGAADAMQLDGITRNFLGVLAKNRRLGALEQVIRAFDALAAQHRGEVTAEVTSAQPLSDDQVSALKAKLKAGLGRDVAVDLQVDPEILGGLVVKVGSRQIDSSIRTKLNSLAYAMKG
jgi:F-type H+-transporting ATPase subunit delta